MSVDSSTTKDEQFALVNKMLASSKPKLLIGAFNTPEEMGRMEWYKFDNREWVWQAHPQEDGEHKGMIFGVKVDDTQPHITTMFLSQKMLDHLWTKRKITIQ